MQGRFQKGVFLGRVDRTNEVMIGVGNQLVRTTKFLRLPEKEQWSAEALEGLRGLVPWTAGKTARGGALEVVFPGPLVSADAGPAGPDTERAEKRLYLTKKLLDKYGRTQGCEGCFPRTAAPRPHTEACRARLEKAWAEDAQKRVAELEELLGEGGDAGGGDDAGGGGGAEQFVHRSLEPLRRIHLAHVGIPQLGAARECLDELVERDRVKAREAAALGAGGRRECGMPP